MRDFGWVVSLPAQTGPGEAPQLWYVVVFVLVLLAAAAVFGRWLTRTETGSQPAVDPEALLNAIDEPVAVLDSDDRVVVWNVPFRSQFGPAVEGEAIEDVFDDQPELREAISERTETVVTLESGGERTYYELCLHPFGEDARRQPKLVVHFHDVTRDRERQSRLEAENEQLDRFASLVSHDLRNPLDVAMGRTNAVAEQLDDPELSTHLSRVQDAHSRMQRIIADVLALAREGHEVGDLEQVPLETAAMDAWSYVETSDATLVIDTQQVVYADPEALTRILENLFRNAVEHGGDDVTVRVASLDGDDGFSVADDGVGIPPEDRESVIEAGVSEAGDGTGLGLAIVSNIASGHGWSVSVEESEEGGAKFCFGGVELVDDGSRQPRPE